MDIIIILALAKTGQSRNACHPQADSDKIYASEPESINRREAQRRIFGARWQANTKVLRVFLK